MRKVNTEANLRSLMRELAHDLECGDSVEIKLDKLELLSMVPVYTIKNGLSMVDAREEGRGAIVVVENRFGEKCEDSEVSNNARKR